MFILVVQTIRAVFYIENACYDPKLFELYMVNQAKREHFEISNSKFMWKLPNVCTL